MIERTFTADLTITILETLKVEQFGFSDLVAYVIRVSDPIVNIKTYLWSL